MLIVLKVDVYSIDSVDFLSCTTYISENYINIITIRKKTITIKRIITVFCSICVVLSTQNSCNVFNVNFMCNVS